jgi:hypothetical protein
MSPLTVTTASLRREGGRWQVDRQDVRVQACEVALGEGESLRLIQIPEREFGMGSPADEIDRYSDEGPSTGWTITGEDLGGCSHLPNKKARAWPELSLLRRNQPKPIWERMPWPVSSSVARPITKPSMARRPFQVSAKATKPKRGEESVMNVSGCEATVTQCEANGDRGPLGSMENAMSPETSAF